jgi:hypothetical protein
MLIDSEWNFLVSHLDNKETSNMSDHRTAITKSLGGDISMHLLKKNNNAKVYVGLWSLWWSDEVTLAGAKVIIATTTTQDVFPDHLQLEAVPWSILQLQTMQPEELVWGEVYRVLTPDIEAKQKETTQQLPRCTGRLMYESAQEDMSRKKLVDPDILEGYTLTRVDELAEGSIRPQSIINRERIQYNVFRGNMDDLRPQQLTVFIEGVIPKKVVLGQRLHTESGLTKTATLLSAVSEWRTWIVLGDSTENK